MNHSPLEGVVEKPGPGSERVPLVLHVAVSKGAPLRRAPDTPRLSLDTARAPTRDEGGVSQRPRLGRRLMRWGHDSKTKISPHRRDCGHTPLPCRLPLKGLLNNPFSEAGGMAAHAAAESKPQRRERPRCARIRLLRAAQALQRANKCAATAAASRLRLTAVAVR